MLQLVAYSNCTKTLPQIIGESLDCYRHDGVGREFNAFRFRAETLIHVDKIIIIDTLVRAWGFGVIHSEYEVAVKKGP